MSGLMSLIKNMDRERVRFVDHEDKTLGSAGWHSSGTLGSKFYRIDLYVYVTRKIEKDTKEVIITIIHELLHHTHEFVGQRFKPVYSLVNEEELVENRAQWTYSNRPRVVNYIKRRLGFV